MLVDRRTDRIWSLLVFASTVTACGDSGVGVGEVHREDVTHSYSAVTLETTTGGVRTDQLARGSLLSIVLHEDGTTTGSLLVIGGGEGGEDLSADLYGTFSFDDALDEVTFHHAADTFLRDMTFRAVWAGSGVQLEGEEMFGDTMVQVTLR